MIDELSTPLGQGPRKSRAKRLPNVAATTFAVAVGGSLVALFAYVLLVDEPLGGEPMVVVALDNSKSAKSSEAGEPRDPSTPAGQATPSQDATAAAADKSGAPSVTIIDGLSGKRQQVTFPQGQEAKIISVDPRPSDAATPADKSRGTTGKPTVNEAAPSGVAGVTVRSGPAFDPRSLTTNAKLPPAQPSPANPALVEQTGAGALPKTGEDGTRPLDVYAAKADPAVLRGNAPRIAIVLTRLGISAGSTAEAFGKLPSSITLGFVPYAADL
ncbi:MAG: uncharacterized protein QOD74_739, partial [Variibacter sp.]|nr:uncharacterized protein [Variibacter sp.]